GSGVAGGGAGKGRAPTPPGGGGGGGLAGGGREGGGGGVVASLSLWTSPLTRFASLRSRSARKSTSPRKRGEVEQPARALPPPSSEPYAITLPQAGGGGASGLCGAARPAGLAQNFGVVLAQAVRRGFRRPGS